MHIEPFETQSFDALAESLTPKGSWAEIVKDPQMKALVVQGRLGEQSDAVLTVKIDQSTQIINGICIETNEHRDCPNDQQQHARFLVATLQERWEAAQTQARKTAESILRHSYRK